MVSASHLQKKKVSHKEGHKKRAKLFQVNRNHITQFANGVALSAKRGKVWFKLFAYFGTWKLVNFGRPQNVGSLFGFARRASLGDL